MPQMIYFRLFGYASLYFSFLFRIKGGNVYILYHFLNTLLDSTTKQQQIYTISLYFYLLCLLNSYLFPNSIAHGPPKCTPQFRAVADLGSRILHMIDMQGLTSNPNKGRVDDFSCLPFHIFSSLFLQTIPIPILNLTAIMPMHNGWLPREGSSSPPPLHQANHPRSNL